MHETLFRAGRASVVVRPWPEQWSFEWPHANANVGGRQNSNGVFKVAIPPEPERSLPV